VIKNARGGASIESMVPVHKFDEHPLAKRYADHVKKRMAEFDPEATADQIWGRQKGRAKSKGQPEPPRPDPKALTSWNVPGKSPSDMGSVHNGYFGVFKGYNIKGVLFHQGFNNTLGDNCRPKRYRVLTKLMVEGWREDFEDPGLPVGIIGFCAGGKPQNEENFEQESIATGPYIREAQRLGLEDVGDPENTEYISWRRHPGSRPASGQEARARPARRPVGTQSHLQSAECLLENSDHSQSRNQGRHDDRPLRRQGTPAAGRWKRHPRGLFGRR
jgi:sialate O-acetylesterase